MTIEENRKKWIAALRSGEYDQGRAYLCKDGKYCCLGVAAHTLGIKVTKEFDGIVWFDESEATAPKSLQEMLGLWGDNGLSSDGMYSLTELNDNGTPFYRIADKLEAGLYWK